ncbi:unnamed protein product [Meloidogyne enterolobii]|uniref:Uncharacterized protein n=1 Tax=Meloidogyne enterolobii TaxID=390850 RepID=A0ACB0ZQR3_MELEN
MIEFFKNPKEFIILQEEINAEKAEENNGKKVSENKWKRKLNGRIMRFIFREMTEIEKKLKKERKIKGNEEKDEEKELNNYLNDLLNEEFKWLNLGIKNKIWEWFLKFTKWGKKKVEKNRKFDLNVFKALKKDLLAIDDGIKNCYNLKDPLLKVLQYEDINDPIHQEFRGRFLNWRTNTRISLQR